MTKEDYIILVAETVKLKATCPQDSVGAVFVTYDYEIIATGYNGAPRGFDHCPPDCSGKCSNVIHAEANAIIQAAKRGTRLEESHLYVTRWPCINCARMLVNLNIKSVNSWGKECSEGLQVLLNAQISCHYLTRPVKPGNTSFY